MTTDSEEARYRGGYAAGQRDAVDGSDEDEAQKRPLTGDDWTDTGYAHGFDEGKRALKSRAFADLRRLMNDVFWIPQISGWLRRVSGRLR